MSTHRPIHVSSTIGDDDGPMLWVEIAADVDGAVGCPLAGSAHANASGTVQLVNDTCHVSLSKEGGDVGGDVRTFTTQVSEDCICPSFCRPGCVPEVIAVDDGSIAIGAYADTRETIADVMEEVRADAAAVRLRRLTTASPPNREENGAHGPMDRISLTEKQREAVQTAVEMGYYETPRDASLADLADRLGVTRSALSQRLNAVETKLVTALATDL